MGPTRIPTRIALAASGGSVWPRIESGSRADMEPAPVNAAAVPALITTIHATVSILDVPPMSAKLKNARFAGGGRSGANWTRPKTEPSQTGRNESQS